MCNAPEHYCCKPGKFRKIGYVEQHATLESILLFNKSGQIEQFLETLKHISIILHHFKDSGTRFCLKSLQIDETVGFPESGMSLPIKVGRIDIPAVLQEASTQLHHQGRVGFYCGGACVLCNAVLCCVVQCCVVLCFAMSASIGAATSLHTVYVLSCIRL